MLFGERYHSLASDFLSSEPERHRFRIAIWLDLHHHTVGQSVLLWYEVVLARGRGVDLRLFTSQIPEKKVIHEALRASGSLSARRWKPGRSDGDGCVCPVTLVKSSCSSRNSSKKSFRRESDVSRYISRYNMTRRALGRFWRSSMCDV